MPGTEIRPRPGYPPVPVPGMPQRRRQSEAAIPRAFRAARRNRHISVPLAVPPAAWSAAEIMHACGIGGYWGVAGMVLTGCVWYFARYKWTGKDGTARRIEVWYAGLSATALWLWLWSAASLGIPPPALAALLVLSGGWGIPWYVHKRPRGQRQRQRDLAGWQRAWEYYAADWDHPGSHVIETGQKPSQVRLRVQLRGGKQTVASLRAVIPRIESALDGVTDIGLVRVEAVKGHPSQADVFLKSENPLRELVRWDPSMAPSTVHGDAVLGLSETGEWVTAPMRVSAFVNGRTRSGKGNHLLLRLAQLSACSDDRQVVIDLKQRAARTLLRTGAVEHVITDIDEARAFLLMLAVERAARARDADTGEEQLLATAMTPAIHTLIDETHPLTSATAGDAQCAGLLASGAAEGSGLEIYFEVYTQYGSLEASVRTEQARSNLPLRACYAVESPDHGDFALGSAARYAGIDASKLEEKGEFCFKLGPKARPERLRAPLMTFELFTEIATANAARLRKPPLILYCGAEPSVVPGLTWQEWWDRRHLRVNPAFRKDSPQYAAAVEEFGEPEPEPARAAAAPPARPAASADVAKRIAEDTSGPDLPPVPGTTEIADARVRHGKPALCAALTAAGAAGISPAALKEASGLGNTQVHDILNRLLTAGAVTHAGRRAPWVPVPGTDIAAVLERIEAGDADLHHQARLCLIGDRQ